MKLVQKYKYCMPKMPQHCPYAPTPRHYGSAAQSATPLNKLDDLSTEEIKHLQHYRQHTLLCLCCQHDSPHGPQHHCKQASKGHTKHHESSTSIVGLPCYSPKCKSLFPRFLPLQTKCTQPCQWPFFPWDLCQSITGAFSPLYKIPKKNTALS